MLNLGMPVPYGFTITTEACNQYYDDGETINEDIKAEIFKNLNRLEGISEKKFGDPQHLHHMLHHMHISFQPLA